MAEDIENHRLLGRFKTFRRLGGSWTLAGAVVLSASFALADDPAQKQGSGFFGNDMAVGSTRKPVTVSDSELYPKRTPPPALVPDIERSNGYSVPAPSTPHPSPTPTVTPTPPSEAPVHTESSKERSTVPRSPAYLQELIGKVKQEPVAPLPTAAPGDLKPAKRPQSYTF